MTSSFLWRTLFPGLATGPTNLKPAKQVRRLHAFMQLGETLHNPAPAVLGQAELPDCTHVGSYNGFTMYCKTAVLTVTQYCFLSQCEQLFLHAHTLSTTQVTHMYYFSWQCDWKKQIERGWRQHKSEGHNQHCHHHIRPHTSWLSNRLNNKCKTRCSNIH
jgi:hypothetical protein